MHKRIFGGLRRSNASPDVTFAPPSLIKLYYYLHGLELLMKFLAAFQIKYLNAYVYYTFILLVDILFVGIFYKAPS